VGVVEPGKGISIRRGARRGYQLQDPTSLFTCEVPRVTDMHTEVLHELRSTGGLLEASNAPGRAGGDGARQGHLHTVGGAVCYSGLGVSNVFLLSGIMLETLLAPGVWWSQALWG
jgi:hypothetical protein